MNDVRRAADHHLIMEVIENAKHNPALEAEADKGNEIEGEEEASKTRAEARPRSMVLPVC